MPSPLRFARSPRKPIFALLGAFVVFSACVPILDINQPTPGTDTDCATFVCENGQCGVRNAPQGTACDIEMGPKHICDGAGECKTEIRGACTENLKCLSNICLNGECKLDYDAACMDGDECRSDLCIENVCRVEPGGECKTAEQCFPADCVEGICLIADGSGCESPWECASGGCVDGRCRLTDGEPCTYNVDCASGACSNGFCLISEGKPCTVGGAACATGSCLGDRCTSPSCASLGNMCGLKFKESCCASVAIPGGTFSRDNNPTYSAKISEFRMDRFEVTVARFRAFLAAYNTYSVPQGGGAQPANASSGWNKIIFSPQLPLTADNAKKDITSCGATSTWVDQSDPHDTLPINCVDWYMAFAFCIWDGGRLPTEAEWNYVAAGGSQQRVYPWLLASDPIDIDAAHTVYDCNGSGLDDGCIFDDILPIGSKSPLGDGRWGIADLSGNMYEWTYDAFKSTYPASCTDCAEVNDLATSRTRRGGSWTDNADAAKTVTRASFDAGSGDQQGGFRCVRETK